MDGSCGVAEFVLLLSIWRVSWPCVIFIGEIVEMCQMQLCMRCAPRNSLMRIELHPFTVLLDSFDSTRSKVAAGVRKNDIRMSGALFSVPTSIAVRAHESAHRKKGMHIAWEALLSALISHHTYMAMRFRLIERRQCVHEL